MTDSIIQHIATVFPINADALKPASKFRRRRSILREFSLNTTAHGIPGIARSASIHNRVFWTVSSVAFTGIMIYFVTQSIIAYFSYPTQTSVSFIVERSQSFPAVSLCNYSPIRRDRFMGPFLNYTNSLNGTNTNDTSAITLAQAAYILDFFQGLFNSGQPVDQYLFPLESMLLYCVYNGEPCQSTDFIYFISSVHGACYTFNAKTTLNNSRIRQTTDNGGYGKLELRLYAHSHQYIPYMSEDASVGMMIMVHDNTELPLIEVAGIQLAAGHKHKLSYKKKTSRLLSSPYSECTNKISPAMKAMFSRYRNADYAYSPVICNAICVQTYVYQECKCVNPYQFTARTITIPGTNQILVAPICRATDSCFVNATNRITDTDSIWNQFCSDCLQACSTVDFTITPSSVLALSKEYAEIYKIGVENAGIPLPNNWSDTWQAEMQNNYIAVNIVCETTRVETYTEDASISPVHLISNIGGQTGLWIGISFLSLMELIEMLYRLIRYHCHVLRRRVRGEHDEHL